MTSDRITFNLIDEPTAELYYRIVDHALSQCDEALLVMRSDLELEPSGKQVLVALEPFLVKRVESSEWPGTELVDDTATLLYYKLEPGSAAVLKRATDRLYDWCQPNLPEDLCFLRGTREPWLVSIAHERDGYFQLTEWERRALVRAIPNLRAILQQEGGGEADLENEG